MISAIVVNYNGAGFLSACLASLAKQTWQDLEVIVVDNASTDGSDRIPEEYASHVRLIRCNKNLGYGAGINTGIVAASGDAILALNNDIDLDRSCVELLARAMEADPRIGMCSPKMLLPDGRLNSTGICISRSGAAWNRDMGKSDPGPGAPAGDEVLGPCGGAALYRRAMLLQVGSFDASFFLYMEDADLAVRGRLAGWKCRYVAEAVVVHANGASAGRGSDLAVYYGNRNILWYTFRDFPLRLLITSLPWILGRNIGVIVYYLLQGRGRIIVRAKVHAIAGLGRMLRERRTVIRSVPYHDFSLFVKNWGEEEARYVGN
jgi:GT2 family glycosyltransferase